MNVEAFFDTNILVYAHDNSDRSKQAKAQKLIFASLEAGSMVLSTQVMSEYFVTATRKLKLPYTDVIEEMHLLSHAKIADISLPMVFDAARVSHQKTISFWDALIVVAASISGCDRLYAEDLNHGQIIEGVRITNPFIQG